MQMLLFYVGNNAYACDSEDVMEVVPKIFLKQVPENPIFAGVMNYAGEPIPVIDFSQLIAQRPSSDSMHTRIIIFNIQYEDVKPNMMGFIAEKVIETRDLEFSEFKDSGVRIERFPFLKGLMNRGAEVIQFVSLPELFYTLHREAL